MKFKVGDKVRVVRSDDEFKQSYIGKEYVIKHVYHAPGRVRDSYGIGKLYMVYENELELVKPKFNIDDYTGNWAMHVNTEEEAKIYLTYLHNAGKRWISGSSLLGSTHFDVFLTWTCYSTCYPGNDGMVGYGTASNAYLNYTILEFEDFDWSDFNMKKEFTKADLKNGDVVKFRNGNTYIVIKDIDILSRCDGYMNFSEYEDDLTIRGSHDNSEYDIVAVRRPIDRGDCQLKAFIHKWGELVYERKEVEEMTLEEVCKALGKEIKIIKEKK